jgi:hypothetical protein
METLEEAKAWLELHKEDGVSCPCCNQFAKIYTRKLNSAMARDLIWLVRRFAYTKDWIDVPGTGPISLQRSRELAKLVYWKLVEQKFEASKRGARTSGIWRPTWPGIMFAENKTSLPKYVRIYDGSFLSFPDRGVTSIREALGDHFNYDELWGRL